MKRTLLSFISTSLICLSSSAMGPKARSLTEEKNYLLSIYPISEVTATNGLSADTAIEEVTYYDGIGRPTEEIKRGFGSSYNDIITFHQYDALGREHINMLPSVGDGTGAYVGLDSYMSKAVSLYGDSVPFSTIDFEESQLSRPLSEMGPGVNWQTADKGVDYQYSANTASGEMSCWHFIVSGTRNNHSLVRVGSYGANQLQVTKMIDEDGNSTLTFTDSEGRNILTRQVTGSEYADTYYVYDDYGNLCYVLSPEGSAAWNRNEKVLATDELGYQYRYDERNRCIAKKLPGASWIYYIYDTNDHLIFVQDGNLREQGKWSMTLYDALGREAISAIYTGDASQLGVDAVNMNVTKQFPGDIIGYKLPTIVSATDLSPRSISFYDDYSTIGYFINSYPQLLRFRATEGFAATYDSRAQGLLTGRMLYLADGVTSIPMAYYYDQRGRMIQQRCGDNYTQCSSYDFRGNTTTAYEEKVIGNDTTWIKTAYSYKHNGLVDTLSISTFGGGFAQMVHSYDSLNRLKTIQYGDIKETYSYNPRGWTTEKNVTKSNVPLLNLKFRYENPTNSNSAPQYGGNISEWEWSRNDSNTNMYSFEYDPLERLAESKHYLNATLSNSLEEKDISYDLNGNMLTMTRVDESGEEDDLAYSYSGNHLTSSTYDSNGNMTYDASSGFSIEWNDLNLIRKVSDGVGVLVNYTYLADGTKIRAVDADGEGLEYRGSLTFRRSSDGTLTPESIAFPGGRFVAMQGADGSIQMVPNYHIADHLGSVRTIIDGSTGQVVETNDYYAFGGRWDRSGSLIDQSNRYRYNGKEEQTTFGTPYSDYGARQYSSASGRWIAVDPLAEKYYSYSPYAFCNNNPVNFVDPDGEKIYFANGSSDNFKEKVSEALKLMIFSGTAGDLLRLELSDINYYIAEVSYEKGGKWNRFNRKSKTIYWDPNAIVETTEYLYMSPMTILAHEAAHAAIFDKVLHSDDNEFKKNYIESSQNIDNYEYDNIQEYIIITGTEQVAARKLGEIRYDQVTRKDHRINNVIIITEEMSMVELLNRIYEHNNLF